MSRELPFRLNNDRLAFGALLNDLDLGLGLLLETKRVSLVIVVAWHQFQNEDKKVKLRPTVSKVLHDEASDVDKRYKSSFKAL